MIDLKKEIHNFEYFCNDFGHVNLAKDKTYRYKNRQTQIMWTHWKARAKLAQAEITELKQKLEKLESGEFVALPIIPNDAISIALSYQCFDFIGIAKIYRDLGFDIPKKAEKEQAFFLHKFLILAIKHGNDFIKVFNSETKAMIEAVEKENG